jgi:hypothetical protein
MRQIHLIQDGGQGGDQEEVQEGIQISLDLEVRLAEDHRAEGRLLSLIIWQRTICLA